jgi:hypothetical protein
MHRLNSVTRPHTVDTTDHLLHLVTLTEDPYLLIWQKQRCF